MTEGQTKDFIGTYFTEIRHALTTIAFTAFTALGLFSTDPTEVACLLGCVGLGLLAVWYVVRPCLPPDWLFTRGYVRTVILWPVLSAAAIVSVPAILLLQGLAG